jgi:membrane protein DedA with SNARE-associated domain/membrane-associated phospholipid phosphatase
MTKELIHKLLPSLAHLGSWGYLIGFLAALLETTIGIGLILPGSTIILFLGALSGQGYLDPGDLIGFAVVGAIIGDNINFYLGRKYGARWLEGGFWLLNTDHIEKARHFMDAHGAKSIFLGRFIPSVKEIVPFIAGSVRMKQKTFMFWNALGGIGWGFEWVFAGYIFSQALQLAEVWLSRAGLFIAFLVVFGIIIYFFKWLLARYGKQFLSIFVSFLRSIKAAVVKNERVALWMQKHPRSISFLKARFDTSVFSGLSLTLLTLSFVYVAALFGGIVEDLVTSDPIVAVDVRIANLLAALRTETLTDVFTWITLLGKYQIILAFMAVAVGFLWLWRKLSYVLPLLTSVAGSEAFTYLGKLAFHRARPETAVYAEHSFSFPSGHATIAVAFYGFAGYLIARATQRWNRKVNIIFATIILIAAIGFSRIYLGEHYLSDVWSGYLVGAMWLIIAVCLSEWFRQKAKGYRSASPVAGALPISIVIALIAVLFYTGFAVYYHPPPATVQSKRVDVVQKSTDIFTSEKMKYTETLTGDKQEPINFILLAADDGRLKAVMQRAGWTLTDKADISSFIKAVKALMLKKPHPSAPIAPSFWKSKIQNMGFAKVAGPNWLSNAQHLKIWATRFRLQDGNKIYVGMANANHGLKWGFFPKISPDLDAARELLYQDLARTGKIKSHFEIQLVKPETGENFLGERFFTDGKALIISLAE